MRMSYNIHFVYLPTNGWDKDEHRACITRDPKFETTKNFPGFDPWAVAPFTSNTTQISSELFKITCLGYPEGTYQWTVFLM